MHLHAQGVKKDKIYFVGNAMVDTLLRLRKKALGSQNTSKLWLTHRGFAVLTMHRPSKVGYIAGIYLGCPSDLYENSGDIPLSSPYTGANQKIRSRL